MEVELLAVSVDHELRDGLRVGPLPLEPLEVRDLDALEILHHEHAPRAVLPDKARDDDVAPLRRRPAAASAILAQLGPPAMSSVLEVPGDDLGVVALVDEVQLQADVHRDLFDQRGEVEVALEAGDDAQQ